MKIGEFDEPDAKFSERYFGNREYFEQLKQRNELRYRNHEERLEKLTAAIEQLVDVIKEGNK